jgi:hypothetical protein
MMKSLHLPLIAAAVLSALCLTSSGASAGCARWGESGYHFYRSCAGPSFLYPHHRRCDRSGICLYH